MCFAFVCNVFGKRRFIPFGVVMPLKPTAVASVSERYSEGGGCGWLCYPHIYTKPERIKDTVEDGRVHSCFKKTSCLAKRNN